MKRVSRGVVLVVVAWAAALIPASAQAAPPASGDILVASAEFGADSTGAVISVHPDNGAKNIVSSNAISTLNLFSNPYGIAREASGSILVADQGPDLFNATDGKIIRVNPATGEQSLVLGNLYDPMAVTVEANGNIMVADESYPDESANYNSAGILRLTAAGAVTDVITNTDSVTDQLMGSPLDVEVGPAGDLLVVDDDIDGATGGILSIEPMTGEQTVFSSNAGAGPDVFRDPRNMFIPPSGDIVVAQSDDSNGVGGTGNSVMGVNRATGAQTLISSGGDLGAARGVVHDYAGRLVASSASAFASEGGLFRIGAGGVQTEITRGLSFPQGITVVPGIPVTPPVMHALTVIPAGTGAGFVTSAPAGIDCGTGATGRTDCTESYAAGTQVTLTATSMSGTFTRWDGAPNCTETTVCVVTMSQAQNVTANFTAAVQPPPADTTPPNTIKGKGPARRITSRTATFNFSSERGAAFFCQLDKKPPKPCTSPKKVRRLSNGKHTFTAIAVDAFFNIDPTPAVWKFNVAPRG